MPGFLIQCLCKLTNINILDIKAKGKRQKGRTSSQQKTTELGVWGVRKVIEQELVSEILEVVLNGSGQRSTKGEGNKELPGPWLG